MPDAITNRGASVRARLLNLARQSGQDYQLLLTRYALERFLYRLGQSEHSKRFALKGAMLLMTWFDAPYRATRDLDLLGFGDPDPDQMLKTFADICAIEADDGISFNVDKLEVDRIRDELAYGGLRIKTRAILAGAQIPVSVDIGFGDATEPGLVDLDYPVLLDAAPPKLRAYPLETVIAEKFEAMVSLGLANTRLKDFYDIWMLSRTFKLPTDRLTVAIRATFARRGTAIPATAPVALTEQFGEDPSKQGQWTAFIRGIEVDAPDLTHVVADLRGFLMPIIEQPRA